MTMVSFITLVASIYLIYILCQRRKRKNKLTRQEQKLYSGKIIVCDIVVITGIIMQIVLSWMAV